MRSKIKLMFVVMTLFWAACVEAGDGAIQTSVPSENLPFQAQDKNFAPENVAQAYARQVSDLKIELDAVRRRHDELATYSGQVSGLVGIGMMIIAVLIAAVGLVFPLVTYFTSIRPANRVIEQARATLDGLEERFSGLLESHKANQVKRALTLLGGGGRCR